VSHAAAYRAEKGLEERTTSTVWVVVGWGLARARAAFEASFSGVPLVARQASGLVGPTEQRLGSVLPALLDARLRELEALDEHDRSLEAAEGDVTLLDKLNFLSDSQEERRVTELQRQRPWLVGGAVGALGQLRAETWGALAGRTATEAHVQLERVLFVLWRLKAHGVVGPRIPSAFESAFYPGAFDKDPAYSRQRPMGVVLGQEHLMTELDALGRSLAELHGLQPVQSPLDLARRCATVLASGATVEGFPSDASRRRLHVDHVVASTAHGIAQHLPLERFFGALRLLSDGGHVLLQQAHLVAQAKEEVSPIAKFLPWVSASEQRAFEASTVLGARFDSLRQAEGLITEAVLRAASPYLPALVHLRYLEVRRRAAALHTRVTPYIGVQRRDPHWRFQLVGWDALHEAILLLQESAYALHGAPLALLAGFVTGSL
jgi:hypothetical protein